MEKERKGTYPNIRVSQECYTPKGSTDLAVVPHAQVKGNVTKDTEVRAATAEKKAFIAFSMGINFPVKRLWDMAKRNGAKDKNYDEKAVFLQVVAYGDMAEKLTKIHKDFNGVLKGDLLDVSGRLSIENYTKQNGDSGEAVRLTLDRFEMKYKASDSHGQIGNQANNSAETSDEELEEILTSMQSGDDDDDIPF